MHMFVTEAIIATGGEAHFSFYMGLIFIPLILVLLSVPAMFIMDLTWNHRKKVILKRARKMGAIEIVDIEIKSNTSPNHVIVDAGQEEVCKRRSSPI